VVRRLPSVVAVVVFPGFAAVISVVVALGWLTTAVVVVGLVVTLVAVVGSWGWVPVIPRLVVVLV
jgi:hypothetical protein